ncbi:NAD(P)/FAD-dependent oxidoreductase [Clostridium ganghwense]
MPKYAALQKVRDGKRTYAVTPRIPGGFIKPDKLIKIAEVTKKYKGVLKMTSGQRIMITGLKAEDVEKIWEELDMEPAVKSPYSVKNVEMCPATFCKRMKQDSLRLGMRLEKRFYAAEAPNRTKIGVAGCRNACGSVHSKDIGVIGTKDEGYVVVAGGSAGFHPRLSDRIASDLTEDEAFIMVETIYEYYNNNAEFGTKLGHFIDEISIEKFRNDVMELFNENLSKNKDKVLE